MNLKFENAQDLRIKYPDTFHAPTKEELDEISLDDCVKVCVCNERFWVIVTGINGNEITAEVNNDLVLTDEHGLSLGDEVTFGKESIYSIYY